MRSRPRPCSSPAEGLSAGRAPRLRRAGLATVLAAAALLAGLHVADPGREDYEGAVRHIAGELAPGDAILAADWQPLLFPHGVGWDF